ncbi:MAG TPA: fatty acid desaturase [Steroidobacteraceae bacterium]|jgi:stearoyl-CoA desaturase (delta-9 desaturase)
MTKSTASVSPAVEASSQNELPPRMWTTTLLFSISMLAAVTVVPWYGLTHGFSVGAWAWYAFFLIANGMSITGGYHRLWAHKTYEAHWILRLFFMIFGAMSLQNSAFVWCSGHRTHHLKVDDVDEDPYSIRRGFWFAHIGWMLREYPSGKADFTNIPDLKRDPLLQFQFKHYIPLALATNIGFPLLAGWSVGDLWGTFILAGVLRLVVQHHVTFFINSLAHMWGARPYTDSNTARDNPVLAFVTYGEGYHNFHHIFAHDYRNGVRWWQFDPTKWMISCLQWVGLTRRLKRTPPFQIQRALLAMQFTRAQERLARAQEKLATMPAHEIHAPTSRHSHIEQLRQRIAHEYEHFHAAVADWAKVKEQWLEQKKREVIEHWEHANFQQRLKEIERGLRMQRRRMRVLHAQLA